MAVLTFFLHGLEDGLFDRDWQEQIKLCGGNGIFCYVLVLDLREVGGEKWYLPGKEFIGDTAKGILIAFLGHPALKLFGCHVRKSVSMMGMISAKGIHGCNETKVSQEYAILSIKEDIFRFEIAMNNVHPMSVLKSLPYLGEDV